MTLRHLALPFWDTLLLRTNKRLTLYKDRLGEKTPFTLPPAWEPMGGRERYWCEAR